jgi:hypothetical protein
MMIASLKRVLIVLGLVLASTFLAHGQSFEHRLTFTQPAGPMVMVSPQRPALIATPSVPLVQDFRHIDPSHDDHNFTRSSLFRTTETPFMTQSRLPIAQAFGARVGVSFFRMSTNNKNVMLGPLAMPQSNQALAQPRSGDQYGISVGIPLGRDAGSDSSKGLWRGVSRVVHRR